MTEPIWALVLAAGQSRRMGRPKQLLTIQGESLLRRVARSVLTVPGLQVAVVGTDDPTLRAQCTDLPLVWIANRHAGEGLSSSIRAGVAQAMAQQAGAVMIVLGDQPDLDPAVMARMLDVYRRAPAPILQACYAGGQPGHPVLFDRSLFAELLRLEGDVGAKALIRRNRSAVAYIEVPSPPPLDLDTWEDYQAYVRSVGAHSE